MKYLILALLFTLSLFGGQVEILDSNINNKIATPKIAISKDIEVNALISYVYSSSLSKVYASYKDGTLKVIDLKNSNVQTVLTGKILYFLALSPDETKLITGIKDGGILIVDFQKDYKTTNFASDIWINKILYSHDSQKLFALQNLGTTGKKKILIWDINNLVKPVHSIDINGSIEKIAIHQNILLALITENISPKVQTIEYFDIETGKLQKFTEVNCSFEKMIDSKYYKFTNEIKKCDDGFLFANYLEQVGFFKQGVISFQTGDLTRNPKRVYGMFPTINEISSVSKSSFVAKHDEHYLVLFDTYHKQYIYLYMFMNNEWLILSSNTYFKASSEKMIANLSIKVDENSSRVLTSDEIQVYNRPDIIENQIKTTIGENK
jgi:WD40 repeat protein